MWKQPENSLFSGCFNTNRRKYDLLNTFSLDSTGQKWKKLVLSREKRIVSIDFIWVLHELIRVEFILKYSEAQFSCFSVGLENNNFREKISFYKQKSSRNVEFPELSLAEINGIEPLTSWMPSAPSGIFIRLIHLIRPFSPILFEKNL